MLQVVQAFNRAPFAEVRSTKPPQWKRNCEAGHGVGGIPSTMRDTTQEKMVVLHRRA